MSQRPLDRVGAEQVPGAIAAADLDHLLKLLSSMDPKAGHRLTAMPALDEWLRDSGLVDLAAEAVGVTASPVRAVLFDKTAERNWALDWHQDRTIAVRRRVAVAGYDRWTLKAGIQHVEPPFAVIERMLTVRVHLDPVGQDNAPLRIVPGSHQRGKIWGRDVAQAVEDDGQLVCLANRGDVWLYRTPILHASGPARTPAQRRVLQVDFSADKLPAPLEWLGIA